MDGLDLSEGRHGQIVALSDKMSNSRSYEVFLKFITWDRSTSKVDVSNVFSWECFQEWISTRPSRNLKHAAQSFQRVLYAHIRGVDKRRPFPEPIEKEFLRRLRDPFHNPFTSLFKDEKKEIGKRGFPKSGFHEAKELLMVVRNTRGSQTTILPNVTNFHSNFSAKQFPGEFINLPILPSTDPFKSNSCFMLTLGKVPKDSKIPWDNMVRVLQQYIPIETRQASLAEKNRRGLDFWTPAVLFFMRGLVDENDNRFSRKFLFPCVEEQVFRLDRPIAQIMFSASHNITHQDQNAVDLFRGSLLGMHLFELFASILSLCYSFIGYVPALYGTGSVWRRDILKTCEGTRMVCIMYIVTTGREYSLTLQNQSDCFPEALNKVSFI